MTLETILRDARQQDSAGYVEATTGPMAPIAAVGPGPAPQLARPIKAEGVGHLSSVDGLLQARAR